MITARRPSFSRFLLMSSLLTGLLILLFAMTRWFDIPAGNVTDWLVGIVSVWWLLAITVIPWNIYFDARTVMADAEISQQRGITVQASQQQYALGIAKRSLIGAVFLHLISALALYGIAASNISSVGYVAAGAAILLTGLRPALRGYEYIAQRLATIHEEVRFPRDDIMLLKSQVNTLEYKIEQLNLEEPDSWASAQVKHAKHLERQIEQLKVELQSLSTNNEAAHRQISREIEHAVAQISTDGQFLEHARELIRFFKQA
ncbi:hypothetical protein [Herpetosiphon llansteffanensis]|uniref:hypothetical protein n=1 Tax=Herpetosiphon llansteffanensis TaxID=2094568 RepID=UPI000D7C8DCA|nr:hypothetical protein [Herpetosiphon llansteffanensis]